MFRRKSYIIFILILLYGYLLKAEEVNWIEISSDYELPMGVRLFKGERNSPKLKTWYLDIDLNNDSLAVRPYITDNPANLTVLQQRFGTIAAVNGGFFGGSVSYSTVLYPDEVRAQNAAVVTRNSKSYPVIRSYFGLDQNFTPSIHWIYHFGSGPNSIYTFEAPLSYSYEDPNPLASPSINEGMPLDNPLVGIGGAPTLVKGGSVHITYNEEVMWGSGVGLSNSDPRTAVGYTTDRHVIILVADGRQTSSEGLSLTELAQVMIELGCTEAMNLDGGGSTQMAIGGNYVNSPSEVRSIPTLLAVITRDSVNVPSSEGYELIIDTGDEACTLLGTGWFPTANTGFWGTTPAMLNTKGDGSKQAIFNTTLDHKIECQVYAWWVAASNRCTDTPIVIVHADGRDTVRVDQTTAHAKWNPIGTFTFNSDPAHQVIISNAAMIGTYVVADAIRLVSNDSITVVMDIQPEESFQTLKDFILLPNFPNPFNPVTQLHFNLEKSGMISLSIFDLNGKAVAEVFCEAYFAAGNHRIQFDGCGLSSGVYICQLSVDGFSQQQKILMIK
jgi:hypothetical protein